MSKTRKGGRKDVKIPTIEESSDEESSPHFPTEKLTIRTLHDLLKELNLKVEILVKNHKETSDELANIKEAVNFTDRNVQEVKSTLQNVSKELKQQEKDITNLRDDLGRLTREVNGNRIKMDDLEQYTRKNSLELHGVPEGVNCEEAAVTLAKHLDIDLKYEDIEVSHRIRTKNRNSPRPIIVKLLSHKRKQELYSSRKNLKDVLVGDVFGDVLGGDKHGKIYINENLTNYRKVLCGKLRLLRKSKTINNTWTLDGKIFLKVKQDDSPKLVRNEADIDHICSASSILP